MAEVVEWLHSGRNSQPQYSAVQYSTSYLPVQPALTEHSTNSETQLIAEYYELGYSSTRQTYNLKMQLEKMYYNYVLFSNK